MARPRKRKPDFRVVNHGSIVLFHLLTKRAQAWVAEHVSDEAQFMGMALVVEPRYVAPLLEGMLLEGFRQ